MAIIKPRIENFKKINIQKKKMTKCFLKKLILEINPMWNVPINYKNLRLKLYIFYKYND